MGFSVFNIMLFRTYLYLLHIFHVLYIHFTLSCVFDYILSIMGFSWYHEFLVSFDIILTSFNVIHVFYYTFLYYISCIDILFNSISCSSVSVILLFTVLISSISNISYSSIIFYLQYFISFGI